VAWLAKSEITGRRHRHGSDHAQRWIPDHRLFRLNGVVIAD
jgi:hypothetical protein